jgi:hypothetical protein
MKSRPFLVAAMAFIVALIGLWVCFGRGDLTTYAGLGDLYPRWYGAQQALLHNRNPYSPEVTGEIQIAYYGHVLTPGEVNDQERFAYPAYVVFYLVPTLWLPFEQVRYASALVILGLIIASIICWARMIYGHGSWQPGLVAALLGIGTVPTFQAVKIQQLAVLSVALISLGIWAAVRTKLILSGILFAFATIKPQLILIPLVWMLVWSLEDWSARKLFIVGHGTALASLTFLGQRIVPGWPKFFVEGLFSYGTYNFTGGVLEALLGKVVGFLLACLLIVPVIVIIYRKRRTAAENPDFLLISALVFCAANACQPWLAAPFNQFLLIPGLLLLFRERSKFRYMAAMGFTVTSFFAVMSGLLSNYMAIAVTIQLALPVVVLTGLLAEVWPWTSWSRGFAQMSRL